MMGNGVSGRDRVPPDDLLLSLRLKMDRAIIKNKLLFLYYIYMSIYFVKMAAFKTHVFLPTEPKPTTWELGLRGNLPVNAPGSTKEEIYTEHFKKDLKHQNLIWWNKHWTNEDFQVVSDKALEDVRTKKVGKKFKYPPWLRTKCTLALLEKENFFTKARDKLKSLNQNNVRKALSQFQEFFGDVTQNQEHIAAFIKIYDDHKDIKVKMPADKIDMPDIRRMALSGGEDAKQLLIDFKTWMFQSSRDFSQAEGEFLPSEPTLDSHCYSDGFGAGIACIVEIICQLLAKGILSFLGVIWVGALAGFIALVVSGAWIYESVSTATTRGAIASSTAAPLVTSVFTY